MDIVKLTSTTLLNQLDAAQALSAGMESQALESEDMVMDMLEAMLMDTLETMVATMLETTIMLTPANMATVIKKSQ